MSDNESQLLQLFKERSLTFGNFVLASGGTSSYYIDGRMTAVFSKGAYLVGEVFFERTKDLALDAVGGLEVGAVPLTTAAVMSYHLHGRTMEGFWVRSGIKDHGTKKLIEGGLKPGSRVAILDDVVTKGTSCLKAVEAVRSIGCEVVLVTAIVDRLQGTRELLQQNGIDCYHPLFTIRDLGVES